MKKNYNPAFPPILLKRQFYLISFFLLLSYISNAQVFDIIVAKDGTGNYKTIQEAINSVTSNKSTRTLIFIKKGYYFEKCSITNKTNVSLIGENRDSVIIAYNDYANKVSGMSGATAMTFLADAAGLYAENITFKNTSGAVGQAPAIKTTGDKLVFKNCSFTGFQGTYYANKNFQYHLNCYVEGAVDFIYGDAQSVFDKCTIKHTAGGYVSAPADSKLSKVINGKTYYMGLLFNECNLTASTGVTSGCYLGRPWGTPYTTSVFTNCTLGTHINSAGWVKMTTDAELTAIMAEYKSKNADGSLTNVSSRVSWSKQLSDADYNLAYNPDVYFVKNGVTWNPKPITYALLKPASITVSGNSVAWKAVKNATGYVIYRNGIAIGTSVTNAFTDTVTVGKLVQNTYNVESVNSYGNLSFQSMTDGVSVLVTVPKDTVIAQKETLQLSASIDPLPAHELQDIVWSVKDTSLASISSTGLLTPKIGGSIVVKAAAKADTSVNKYVTITAKDIFISSSKTIINRKETLQLTATVEPVSLNQDVTWYVNDASLAQISQSGLLTSIKAGYVKIIAKWNKDTSLNRAITVQINEIVDSVSVSGIKDKIYLTKGDLQLSVSVYPSSFSQTVLWSSKDTSAASLTTNGLIKPKKTGTITVTVKAQADTSVKKIFTVTIAEMADSVNIASPKDTITLNAETLQFTSSVYPSVVNQEVLWRVSDNSIATVSETGLLTPKTAGTITVVAKSKIDTTVLASKTIVIKNQVATSVNNKKEVEIYPNPVHDKLFIKSTNVQISIYSINGEKKISIQNFTGHGINVSDLLPGIYWIKVNDGKTTRTVKFLKQ
jgi:pectinesterase